MALVVTFHTPGKQPVHAGPYEDVRFEGGQMYANAMVSADSEPLSLAEYEKFTGNWLHGGKRYAYVSINQQD